MSFKRTVFFFVIIVITFSDVVVGETDQKLSVEELSQKNQVHSQWLAEQSRKTVINVSNIDGLNKKLREIEEFRLQVKKYFYQNDGEMLPPVRLDFRALFDLYLLAIPTKDYFEQKDCPRYWAQLLNDFQDVDVEKNIAAKTSIALLSNVCNRPNHTKASENDL